LKNNAPMHQNCILEKKKVKNEDGRKQHTHAHTQVALALNIEHKHSRRCCLGMFFYRSFVHLSRFFPLPNTIFFLSLHKLENQWIFSIEYLTTLSLFHSTDQRWCSGRDTFSPSFATFTSELWIPTMPILQLQALSFLA